jgi:hypothetical protein
MRTETDRNKTMAQEITGTHKSHTVTKTATTIPLMLQNFLSPLTMVTFQDCSWFIRM